MFGIVAFSAIPFSALPIYEYEVDVSESVAISESSTGGNLFLASITDSLTLSSIEDMQLIVSASSSETITLSEEQSGGQFAVIDVDESIIMIDNNDAQSALFVSVSDVINLIDKNIAISQFAATIVESTSLSESYGLVGWYAPSEQQYTWTQASESSNTWNLVSYNNSTWTEE